MKIFITGATGFIGSQLTKRLLAEGHEVNALARSPEKAAELKKKGIDVIFGDLDDQDAIDLGMKHCDVVFHLAAYTNPKATDKELLRTVNVEGTRNVLKSARENNVDKVIFTSLASVFKRSGSARSLVLEGLKKEASACNPYVSSKAEAEEIALAFANAGMHVVIVNPTTVYGPDIRNRVNSIFNIDQLYNGKMRKLAVWDDDKIGCFCFIDDVVDGLLKAWKFGKSGENYILGGENATSNHFFNLLGKFTGVDLKISPVSRTLSVLGAKWRRWRGYLEQNAVSDNACWPTCEFYDANISSEKAINNLGYTVTPLVKGLKKTIEWLKKNDNSKKFSLVTGASTGIGRALAMECASRNQNLILVALPDSGLKQVKLEIEKKYPVEVRIYETNLVEPNAIKNLYNWCHVYQLRVNVLINNAGIGNCSSFIATDLEHYLKMIRLNSEAVVNLSRTFIPKLKEHKQSYILNMGSFASLMPIPFKSVYSATKSFVLSFSRSLEMELKPLGIHVSCLCPGPTRTETVIRRHELLGQKSELLMLSPEEVAKIGINGLLRKKGLIVPGWKNKMILNCKGIFPFSFKRFVLTKIFEKGVEQTEEIPVDSTANTPLTSALYEYGKNLN